MTAMMIKIALFLIFYNNKPELERLLDSFPPKVIDYLIAIDGPFRYNLDMDHTLPQKSDDGSIELIKNSSHKLFNQGVILEYMPGATEFEKRNRYLEICDEKKLRVGIDCGIIVDSDEFFIYPDGIKPLDAWQRFIKNIELEMIKHGSSHNVFGISYEDEAKTDTYKPRIFLKPSEMRYVNNSHFNYYNVKLEQKDVDYFNYYGMTYCQSCLSIIRGGVTLTQDNKLRSEEYLERRKKYQQWLVAYETMVQQSKRYTHEKADAEARQNPATNFDPT
jgi:hypothetical protein